MSCWQKFNIADCIENIDALAEGRSGHKWFKKENNVPLVQDEEEEIIHLAHRTGLKGFDVMGQDKINKMGVYLEKELN